EREISAIYPTVWNYVLSCEILLQTFSRIEKRCPAQPI
ncbi:hypothetical protein NPIL_537721, partial [Nephila pilipes]